MKKNPSFDPSLLAEKKLPRPIRTGVLGLGRIGWLHHAATIQYHNGFKLHSVCDVEPARVEEATSASGCGGFTDYDAFLAQKDLELVIVASQSQDHERHTIQALAAGKHVLCEKPACLDPEGLRKMTAVARKARRLLAVHHNQRLYPDFLAIKEVVESGKLGDIFRIRRAYASFQRRNDWQVLMKYNGGILSNWGTHIIDQTLHLANSTPRHVWSTLRREFNPGDAEDDLRALITCENGIVLDLEVSYVNASKGPSWVVQGSRGTAWIQGKSLFIRILQGRIPTLKVLDGHMAGTRTYGAAGDKLVWKEEERPAEPLKPHEGYYDNLYRAIRQGKPLLVGPESALPVYETIARIREGTEFDPSPKKKSAGRRKSKSS
jgi:scyllo-inositol 2-dehydrogenase (NADP+)